MVPNSFGPRNLGPKKFGLHVKTIVRHFQGPNFAGPKFLPKQFQKIKVDNKRINLPRLFLPLYRNNKTLMNCKLPKLVQTSKYVS